MHISSRISVFGALGGALLGFVSPATTQAQLVIDHQNETTVRGFHVARPGGGVKRSFQSDAEARAEFERILSAVGLGYVADRVLLRASAETSNAEAGIDDKGNRFIFYNATFMQKLKVRTAEHWSLVSVLAHELGHHIAFHTEITGNEHKYELEADYFSGFVLRRLGASLEASHAAMKAISPKEATPTHPGLEQRLQVITIGWTDAGATGAPGALAERTPGAALAPGGDQAASRIESLKQAKSNAEGERSRHAMKAESERGPKAADSVQLRTMLRDCPDCPEMVVVPAGSFMMGSPPSEEGRRDNEGTQRTVTISKPFAVGKFEVTRDQFEAFVKESGLKLAELCTNLTDLGPKKQASSFRRPGFVQTGSHPVVCVSWNEAKAYVAWLTKRTGKAYRLLSEAEWEYAARATTVPIQQPRYHFGDDPLALCEYGNGADLTAKKLHISWNVVQCEDGHVYTAAAGSFKHNAFGLFDMHGNVWEWVEDCYNDSFEGAPIDGSAFRGGDCSLRVFRGGSWRVGPNDLRIAFRLRGNTESRVVTVGFRVARTL